MQQNALKFRRIVTEKVEITKDEYSFKMGDIVRVKDGSYNLDAFTKENRHGIDPLFKNNTAEIISVNEPIVVGTILGEDRIYVRLDLLFKFPFGNNVWCSSICVERI